MIEITHQAIDQASNRVRGIWHNTCKTCVNPGNYGEGEGLYSWLRRMAEEALEKGEELSSGKIRYNGMKFGFFKKASPSASSAREICEVLHSVERVK